MKRLHGLDKIFSYAPTPADFIGDVAEIVAVGLLVLHPVAGDVAGDGVGRFLRYHAVEVDGRIEGYLYPNVVCGRTYAPSRVCSGRSKRGSQTV